MATDLTIAEARQRLSIINSAIDELIQGKRRTKLTVGTHEFMRARSYEGLSYQELTIERDRLLAYINANDTSVTPTFRRNSNFPLIITREPE